MKGMKKILFLFAAAAALFILASCSHASAREAGTASAEAQGFGGKVTVSVTVQGNRLTHVQAQGDAETLTVGSEALRLMPARMLERNSIEVDTVSGATITSYAVLTAAGQALEELGYAVHDFRPVRAAPPSTETVYADVVIVGGGGAGIAAAMAAREAGKSAALLEKLDILGGNTSMSGGVFTRGAKPGDPPGTMTVDELYDFYIQETSGRADPAVVRTYVDRSVENQQWAFSMGRGVPENGRFLVNPDSIMAVQAKSGNAQNGHILMKAMIEGVRESGTDIYTGTTAVDLIVENGNVTGVIAKNKDGSRREFRASGGVVLATGGFPNNSELLKAYLGEGAELAHTRASIGPAGEGMLIASAIGADIKFGPNWDTIGAMCEKSFPMASAAGLVSYFSLMVNNRGARFVTEDGQYPEIFHVMVEHLKAGDTAFFMVYDAKSLAAISDGSFDLEASTRRGSVIRADTLEELAQKMEVPQAAFLSTVARYNGMGQNDTDFNKRPQYIINIQEPPFYALKVWPFRTTTIGGLVINKDAQVLNTQGVSIPGLYAAGEVANYSFFYNKYATCGSAVGHAITFGRIAGINAATRAR